MKLKMHLEPEMRVRAYLGDQEYFVESDAPMALNVESVLAAAFFPALANGDTVVADCLADRTFVENMTKLATVASQWWGWKDRKPFLLDMSRGPRPASSRAALFFTGGVDSFCSLLRHPSEIQSLILVHGFDIPLSDAGRWAQAKCWVDQVAQACKIETVHVTTNLRDNEVFSRVSWEITHVAALAGVAHLLDRHFGRVFLASSDVPPPWGSNQRIDPLWSSSAVQIVNDGCHLSRLEKVRFISGSRLVHKYLRVCWENGSSGLNCGYCEKCVRTQAEFAVSGALECLETFPPGHLKEKIDGVDSTENELVRQWVEISRGISDPGLRRAIERLLARSRNRKLGKMLPAGVRRFLKSMAGR